MTLGPTFNFRWGAPALFLAAAGLLLTTAFQNLMQVGLGDAWLVGLLGLFWLGAAAYAPASYIRVDDSAIAFGPKLLARSRFPVKRSHSLGLAIPLLRDER